jgi:hypothetical protein
MENNLRMVPVDIVVRYSLGKLLARQIEASLEIVDQTARDRDRATTEYRTILTWFRNRAVCVVRFLALLNGGGLCGWIPKTRVVT